MVEKWAQRMHELTTINVVGFISGLATSMWGWVSQVDVVGAVGIFGVAISMYFQYRRHLREESSHQSQRGKSKCK